VAKSDNCASVFAGAHLLSSRWLPAHSFANTAAAISMSCWSPEAKAIPHRWWMACLEGRVDVAFIRPPIVSSDALEVELLVTEDMARWWLPHTHPLGANPAPFGIAAGNWAAETFIPVSPRRGSAPVSTTRGSASACSARRFHSDFSGQEAPAKFHRSWPMGRRRLRACRSWPRSTSQIRTDEVVLSADCGGSADRNRSALHGGAPRPVADRAPSFLAVARQMARGLDKTNGKQQQQIPQHHIDSHPGRRPAMAFYPGQQPPKTPQNAASFDCGNAHTAF